MIRIWKRRILKSLIKFLKSSHSNDFNSFSKGERNHLLLDFKRDVEAGKNCLFYSSQCTWWEWKGGSRLFFWRWPSYYKEKARDGISMCWLDEKKRPNPKKVQPPLSDDHSKKLAREKLIKVRKLGYVKDGFVKSLIRYFYVPKGENDIRMVYDGTSSGFNHSIYVPNFGLPAIKTLL